MVLGALLVVFLGGKGQGFGLEYHLLMCCFVYLEGFTLVEFSWDTAYGFLGCSMELDIAVLGSIFVIGVALHFHFVFAMLISLTKSNILGASLARQFHNCTFEEFLMA